MSKIEIPIGYCQCGCGKKTHIADHNRKDRNWIKGQPLKYISSHYTPFSKGEKSIYWKGGKYKDHRGYIYTLNPNRFKDGENKYLLEHVVIAKKIYGKKLPPDVIVHHHNKTQLVICENHAYHMFLHQRMRALKECGHAKWKKCWICKKYDDPENLYVSQTRTHNFHRECNNIRRRKIGKSGDL